MATRRQRAAAMLRSNVPAPAVSRPSADELVMRRRPMTPGDGFLELPAPTGARPYRRHLADVIGSERSAEIARAGAVRFHCVGDTGGHRDPMPQRRVAAAMVAELDGLTPASFLYHLGDVVYPHGEEGNYRSQFHAAYADYTAPIFAVPGNHDAEGEAGLEPFIRTFCSPAPPLRDAATPPRPQSQQPNVYWTLVHDRVRIIGLYANVPEGGQLADDQLEWLVGELRAAPRDVPLILAVHQPVFSADATHGSNLTFTEVLDACATRAGRGPDAVFTGHAHIYERFTRRRGGREIPHVVAGAGGYPELHALGHGVDGLPATFPALDGVTLDAYEDGAHGFMTVTAGPGGAEVVYTAVAADGATRADAFAITPPGIS